jgi:hypothetical protein
MKDVLSLAVFAGKVLCLVMFVARPEVRQHWRSSDAGETRRLQNRTFGTAGMRADPPCSGSAADVRPCNAHPRFAHC